MDKITLYNTLVEKYNLYSTKNTITTGKVATIRTLSDIEIKGNIIKFYKNELFIVKSLLAHSFTELRCIGWDNFTNEPIDSIIKHLDSIMLQYNEFLKKYKEYLLNKKLVDIEKDF